jgi:hypothetical protein
MLKPTREVSEQNMPPSCAVYSQFVIRDTLASLCDSTAPLELSCLCVARAVRCCCRHASSYAKSISDGSAEVHVGTYLCARRVGEVHVVHSIHKVLGGDALTTEEAAVEALDGILATLDSAELDIDFSVSGTGSDTNVYDLPVTAVAFFFNVFFKILVPIGLLSAEVSSQYEIFIFSIRECRLTPSQCKGP